MSNLSLATSLLVRATARLLDCPDLNQESLDEQTINAVRTTRTLLHRVNDLLAGQGISDPGTEGELAARLDETEGRILAIEEKLDQIANALR